MNKEEIKHFKSLLRQGSLRHMNIIFDDKFQKELLNIIKDYEKLHNNWNKLKEWLEEETQDSLNTWGEVYPRDTYKNVLEQMQEIEGGMNE